MRHQRGIQITAPPPQKKREPNLRTEPEGRAGVNCKDTTKIMRWDLVPSVLLHFNSFL